MRCRAKRLSLAWQLCHESQTWPCAGTSPQVVLQSSQQGRQVSSFTYTGKYSQWAPGDERVHINFWMFKKVPPRTTLEVALDCFWFCPADGKPCRGHKC